MNLDSVIYHRKNGLNNPNNSRYSAIKKDSLLSSKYNVNNVNDYMKSLPYNESSFKESLDLIKTTEKESNMSTNVLYDTLSEMVYHIFDIESCKSIYENHDISNNLLESTIDSIICVDRMKRNYDKLNSLVDLKSIIESNKNDTENLTYEICNEINKYKDSNSINTRINLALETMLYLDASSYDLDIENIIENVSQYFRLQEGCSEHILPVIEANSIIKMISEKKIDTKIKKKESSKKKTIKGSAKEIIEQIKNTSIDDLPTMKKLVYKLYTKSPDNIIEETPNLLSWIRKSIVMLGSASIGPIGLVPIIIDSFIELKLKRKHTDELIKDLKKEIEITENKMDKLTRQSTIDKYEKYLDELNKGLDKLEDYSEDIGSDDKDDDSFDESADIIKDIISISIEDYMNNIHHDFITNVDNASRLLYSEINNRFKFLIEDGAYASSDVEEIDNFIMANKESIKNYISPIDNKVTVRLGIILPLAIKQHKIDKTQLMDMLDEICSNILFKISDRYDVFFDGDYDMYNIYISSTYRINPEEFDREEYDMQALVETGAYLKLMEESLNNITSFDLENTILENILNYSTSDLVNIYEYNEMIKYMDRYDYMELLEELRNEIFNNTYNPYMELMYNEQIKEGSKIRSAIFTINRDFEGLEVKPDMRDRYTTLYETYVLSEYVNDIKNISINESITSSLKIAREKLVKTAKTLSAKEKLLSNKIDNAVAKLEDDMQKAVSNKNREQVIRGSVLPSLSSIVKIAITSGALGYLIDPALAAITVVASFAVSKHCNKKEREYILDEIDIELKMVEKKMQLAEANNDMEAMEQLLRTERRLKRERKRIFYKLRANHYPGDK